MSQIESPHLFEVRDGVMLLSPLGMVTMATAHEGHDFPSAVLAVQDTCAALGPHVFVSALRLEFERAVATTVDAIDNAPVHVDGMIGAGDQIRRWFAGLTDVDLCLAASAVVEVDADAFLAFVTTA